MHFFLDTADLEHITTLKQSGMVDGITTNPSLVMKSKIPFIACIQQICQLISGPVSAEVIASDYDTMLKEAYKLADIANNIVIKLPLTHDGLRACRVLASDNIKTNVTLCFTANQAILAAKAGATYISPFIGRLEDSGENGIGLIKNIRTIYDNYHFSTQILAASIRSTTHIEQAAIAGAHIATIPAQIFNLIYKHPLTDKGLDKFNEDWKQSNHKIL